MILGVLSVLIFPKLIGVASFGYYQLYIFYSGYTVITALGWADGVYLRVGGQSYEKLNVKEQSSQFWLLTISQTVLYTILCFLAVFNVEDPNKRIVLLLTCICAIIINPRYYLKLILQSTGRIQEYALVEITERLISIAVSLVFVLIGFRSYILLIVLDVIGRFLSFCIGVLYCKNIVFTHARFSQKTLIAVKDNISSGFMVLFATQSSSLIIGIVRYSIENHWDITTFSKISLTVSIANMALRCIDSIAIVMFPALRRTDERELPVLYGIINTCLIVLVSGSLLFYQPAAEILKQWLPKYKDSIRYAAILLPICIFECKNSMLVTTYIKTIRKERILFWVNLVSLACSGIFSLVFVYLLNSVELSVPSILVVLLLRCAIGEVLLGRGMQMKVKKNILLEIYLSAMFVLSSWYLGWFGMLTYAFAYLGYLFIKKKDIKEAFAFFKKIKI